MPTVDQMLRTLARNRTPVPYWVLEKDYALSYLLVGIARIDELSEGLILKGGTALRKFHFQGYRFSEDADFSIRPEASLSDMDTAMGQAAREMEWLLQERGPFRVQVERLTLRELHPGGQDAFTVRIRFPTHREAMCRLKVEIAHDELVLLPARYRKMVHEFPEELSTTLRCYPLEEIAAEKLRALLQSRARLQARGWGTSRVCRDYYDLWYILHKSTLQRDALPDLVARKCAHRGVVFESPGDFFAPGLLEVARMEWGRQLRPFVPDCPDVEQVLGGLEPWVMELFVDDYSA